MDPLMTDEKRLLHELQLYHIELEKQNEDLRQSQILLEASRNEYRDRFVELFDFAPIGYLTLNGDNLIIEINLTAASMLGIERKNLILRDFFQYLHGESRYLWQNYFSQLLQHSENQTCELIMQRGDGSTFDTCLYCSLTTSNENTPSLLIALTDVSEQKLKELQLSNSEQRYANILESAMDAIITINAEQEIMLFNKAAEIMFGCKAEEAIGSSLQRFIPEQFRQAHAQQIRDFGVGASPSRKMGGAIVHGLRANGEVFPIEVSISNSETNGEKSFTAILRDISDLKRVENELIDLNEKLERRVQERTQELVHAQKQAEAANRAKSIFLANMSHEIRTPLNGIIGMTDVLMQKELTPEYGRMLSTIQNSSLGLLTILNDILDFSKIEAGKLEVESVPTPLRQVIDDVWWLMEVEASRKGTQLELFIDAALPLWIFSDPMRLRQILFNLLGNAMKFVETGKGKVMLKVQPIEHADRRRNVQFQITDNGIGIKPEMLDKLFQAFTQADESMARKYGGTGLGLSITQRLVALLQGEIRVNSLIGSGSEFIVELPLLEASPDQPHLLTTGLPGREIPAETSALSATTSSSYTLTIDTTDLIEALPGHQLILLAEDNAINLEVMQEQLSLLGYVAEMAEDGEVALSMWRNGRYGLLLTDCQMPNLDGYGLTAAIRQEEPDGSHLPIIAVTANATRNEMEHCLQCGMDDMLSKPFRLDQLRTLLSQWLPLPKEMPKEVADAATLDSNSKEDDKTTGLLLIWDAAVLPNTLGDKPKLIKQLLEKFLIDAQERVTTIVTSAKTGDMNQICRTAHALKSLASVVGAMQLGELSQELEAIGKSTDVQGCQVLVDGLQAAFDRSALEIKQYLAKNPWDETNA